MSQQTINIPDGFELVQISETTFEIKKKQKQLPKTWEEFCKINSIIKEGESYITNFSEVTSMHRCCSRKPTTEKNMLPTKKDAEGILALIQLIQLRDYYNDGWRPDYTNHKELKYEIYYDAYVIQEYAQYRIPRVLAFKTPELRGEFLKNFKDLIEQAKDFI